MRESRTYGSVRGALSNERPYRDRTYFVAVYESPKWHEQDEGTTPNQFRLSRQSGLDPDHLPLVA